MEIWVKAFHASRTVSSEPPFEDEFRYQSLWCIVICTPAILLVFLKQNVEAKDAGIDTHTITLRSLQRPANGQQHIKSSRYGILMQRLPASVRTPTVESWGGRSSGAPDPESTAFFSFPETMLGDSQLGELPQLVCNCHLNHQFRRRTLAFVH